MKKDKLTYNLIFKWFIWCLTVVLCIYHAIKGQTTYLESGIMFVVSAIGVDVLFKIIKVKLSNSTDFIIQVFIFACLFLGKMYGVYEILPWWDSFVHFISGILLAIGSLLLAKSLIKEEVFNQLQPVFMAIYVFLSSTAAAGIWEVWEFAGDQLFGFNSQLNSLIDTMTDICMGTCGAFIACFLVYHYFKSKKFKFIGEFIEIFSKLNKK